MLWPDIIGYNHLFNDSGIVTTPSTLLLVAKVRQIAVGNLVRYRLCMGAESNRYGLCHDYVDGSLDVIEACYDFIGSSRDGIAAYPSNKLDGISPAFILK